MLRKLGPSLLYSCRSFIRPCRLSGPTRAMCIGGFKSAYSLDTLYPKSSTEEVAKHKVDKQTAAAYSAETFNGKIPTEKLTIKYSHSSGPGGQHVNKVNTKADVRFHVASAEWLPQHIKDKILEKKNNRINKAGELVFISERTRSQITNFSDCLQKIRDAVEEVSRKPKEPTVHDKAVFRMRIEMANRERLKQKKMRSTTKKDRQVYAD